MDNVRLLLKGIGLVSPFLMNTTSFVEVPAIINSSYVENYGSPSNFPMLDSATSTESSFTSLESDTSTKYNNHILQEGGAMVSKMNKNLIAINNLRKFEENWNGYGAKGFSSELCDFVEELIKSLDENFQPKLFPTGRESIQIEYEKENGEYLEIEIFSSEQIQLFQILESGEEIEKEISFEEIERLVKAFNGI